MILHSSHRSISTTLLSNLGKRLQWQNAGPPNGICTKDCKEDTSVCQALSDKAVCVVLEGTVDADGGVTFAEQAYCVEGCDQGPVLSIENVLGNFDNFKCHGRRDMACTPFDAEWTRAGCMPTCNSDLDCGTKKCDPERKLCVDKAKEGLPLGSMCTEWNESKGDAGQDCAGMCMRLDPDKPAAFCTEACVFGDVTSCGFNNQPSEGFCLFKPAASGNGDTALCAQLCSSNADCLTEGMTCDLQWETSFLKRGVCLFSGEE